MVLSELKKTNLSGMDLINSLEKYLGKKPSSGSIYPLLKDLTDKEFVEFTTDKNKKIYSITSKGLEAVEELIKEKGTMLLNITNVLNHLSVFDDKNYKQVLEKIMIKNSQNNNLFLPNADLWIELTNILLLITENQNLTNQDKIEIRNILDDSLEKLKKYV